MVLLKACFCTFIKPLKNVPCPSYNPLNYTIWGIGRKTLGAGTQFSRTRFDEAEYILIH